MYRPPGSIVIITSLLLLSIAVVPSCAPEQRRVDSSLVIVEDYAGDTIKVDDFISISYVEKTADGALISSANDYDERPALMFRERSQFKHDFFEMIGHLSKGDSANFTINAGSVLKRSGRNILSKIKDKKLIYNVRINQVISRGRMSDSSFHAAIEALRRQENEVAKQAEPEKISRYVRSNHLLINKTASGMQYVILQHGKGRSPKPGDTVLVNYTGKSLQGKVFETSSQNVARATGTFKEGKKYGPMKIPVSKAASSGFLQAAAMFPVGAKATLIIPSHLGYGAEIHNNIQPFTPLICEISIEDIISPKLPLIYN